MVAARHAGPAAPVGPTRRLSVARFQPPDPVRRTEVDGVPVFYIDAGPRTHASIAFRVGRADEPFTKVGISHVVEHLAIHQLGDRAYPINGSVDHVITGFFAAGEADESAAYVQDIVGALGALETDRLPVELRVLRSEAAQRGPNVIDAQLTYRYGTEGPGRASQTEFALQGLTAGDVTAWAGERFTAGNAAAWLGFAPPAGFRLPLPEGQRQPVGPRRPIDPLPLPSFGPIRSFGGVSLGGPVARTSPDAAMARILRSRMERRLRRDLGLSYETSLAYLPLDGVEAYVSLFASCGQNDAIRTGDEVLRLLDDLARDGATPEELAEEIDQYDRATAGPDAIMGDLIRCVANELLGHPQETTEELRAELAAVTSADIADSATRFRATALGIGPEVPTLPAGWSRYPVTSAGSVDGRRFDHVSRKFPWSTPTQVLIVGADGVTWIGQDATTITVRYAQCAGVVRHSRQRLVLYGTDGFRVYVDPGEWKRGGEALDMVDRAARSLPTVTMIED